MMMVISKSSKKQLEILVEQADESETRKDEMDVVEDDNPTGAGFVFVCRFSCGCHTYKRIVIDAPLSKTIHITSFGSSPPQ